MFKISPKCQVNFTANLHRSRRPSKTASLPEEPNETNLNEFTPQNLTHYAVNPYTFEESNMALKQSLQIQANIWRKFQVKVPKETEYKYEYFVELDPAEVGYRAMLLNIQFMGTVFYPVFYRMHN